MCSLFKEVLVPRSILITILTTGHFIAELLFTRSNGIIASYYYHDYVGDNALPGIGFDGMEENWLLCIFSVVFVVTIVTVFLKLLLVSVRARNVCMCVCVCYYNNFIRY